MRKAILILWIMLLSISLFAQEEVIRKDGRTIIIYNNGTWKYKQELKAKIDKTLSDQEYGKYSFDLPALRFYSIMIHFIRGGNNVTLTDITPPPDGEKYIENKENGTFVIDKVNSEFKYVTCKFKKEGIYKLKYSIKKKKWILLNQQDLMGNKIEIESY